MNHTGRRPPLCAPQRLPQAAPGCAKALLGGWGDLEIMSARGLTGHLIGGFCEISHGSTIRQPSKQVRAKWPSREYVLISTQK